MKVLAIDPSGNFVEGKGSTGWVLAYVSKTRPGGGSFGILKKGTVLAKDYKTRVGYWEAIINLIEYAEPDQLVIEDYKLYNHKGMQAKTQSYSQMETPRLLGLLEYYAEFVVCVPLKFQMATDVRMYKDETMQYNGLLRLENKRNLMEVDQRWVSCNEHERMAFKHFVRWFDKTY